MIYLKITKLKIKNYKGFTLMELLVVIAIIGIMSAVALTSMAQNRDQRYVQTEARKVAAAIREAQSDALSGKTINNDIPCEFVWRTWDTTTYRIRLRQQCPTPVPVPADDIVYTLLNGVTFKNEDSDSSQNYAAFIFSIPFGSVTNASSGSVATASGTDISFTLEKGSYCEDITVSSSGNVTEGPVKGCS